MGPRAVMGMTIGAGVMVFFGAIWILVGIYAGRPVAGGLRAALLIAGLALAAWVGLTADRARHLSSAAPPMTSQQTAEAQEIGRRFGWISGLEGGAMLVAVLLLNLLRRPNAILPTVAVIVGLHFFPLAVLFAAPVYWATGALGCAIGVLGLCISEVTLRRSFVGLAFGILLWLTAAMVLLPIHLPAQG